MKPTPEDFAAATAAMPSSDFTKAGEPKMKPLNALLAEVGFDKISVAERDALMVAPLTPAKYRITNAALDPVTVTIQGKVVLKAYVGEEFEASDDTLEVLANSNIEYERA